MTVSIRRAELTDEREVARFESAFDGRMLEDETHRFLADERHHLLLGYLDGRPAGFVSAVEVFHPDKPSELFLNEIAVIDGMRRRGVARALVDELKRVGSERGCVNMWVLTERENAAALGLYGNTGGRWDGRPQMMFEWDLTRRPET